MTKMFAVQTTIEVVRGAVKSGPGSGGAPRLFDDGAAEGRAAWEASWSRACQGGAFVDRGCCAERALVGERTLCAASARLPRNGTIQLDRAPAGATYQLAGREPGRRGAPARGVDQ